MKKIIALIVVIASLTGMMASISVYAKEAEQKVVRVGWFDSPFCYFDQYGRRCGADYEYQQKISAYTGWTYEYVEDSWPNLLQMLGDGEIDLLSDVSFVPERTEYISYSDLPMGSESYYIYVDAENRDFSAGNPASFNGTKIGVNRGSVQEGFLTEWKEKNSIDLEVVPMTMEEDKAMDMVTRGELDGFVSIYTFSSEQKTVPILRVGASEYFYAVNKSRPDLLAELNMALAGIQDEDPTFSQRISQEWLYDARMNAHLTPDQEEYLAEHGAIRIGYQEDCFPFCRYDKETGGLTGALKDYLAHVSNQLGDTGVRFVTKPYGSIEAALEAMQAGEIDCVFPVNLSSYDADKNGVRLTNPVMTTEMNAVTRDTENRDLSHDSAITFAVKAGSPNIETFIMGKYQSSDIKTYPSDRALYKAVSSGEADCLLISSYTNPAIEDALNKYKLFSVPTGETMPLSFAVGDSERDLYFILNKLTVMTKTEDMDSALASYMHSAQKVTFSRFLRDNWVVVVSSISAVFIVIVVLLIQKLRAERKANEQKRLLEEASEIAELKQTITSLLDNMPGSNFTKDAESGVYLACNQAFAEYAQKTSPEEVVGRTDAEIFDSERAKRFTEDDKMTLSMDGPYIYFEDEPDSDGGRRHIKTTRLKYTDAAGRLCVLGMSQDVTTDTVRIHRSTATTKEAYEKARNTGIIYTHLAQALARGYSDLYHVNLDTEEFIEYRTDEDSGTLAEVRSGWHFFEECQEEAEKQIYADDLEDVKKALDRRNLVAALERNNAFIMTYRLIGAQGPTYVTMKVSRMQDDDRYIILAVLDVDEQMRQRRATVRMREEQVAYNRLSALAGDFLCIYVVVPETGRYREFSAAEGFRNFARPKEGLDFFDDSREQALAVIYPEDQQRFLAVFTRENVMTDVGRLGFFTLSYRLMLDGSPRHVRLKAVMLEEKEGKRLIVGINDIDSQIRQEEAYAKNLAQAQMEANIDALTGVKNRHAYLMAEEKLNIQIKEKRSPEFAVSVLDVNNLKKINDTLGHKAGDQYIRDACKIICDIFKHSPVFRIGGDEFAVISQGSDYMHIGELIGQVLDHNAEAQRKGGVIIACGMAKRDKDASVASVFERADREMYENKSKLKEGRK